MRWFTSSSAFLLRSVSGFAFVFENAAMFSGSFGVSFRFVGRSIRPKSSVSFFPVKAAIKKI